MGSSAAPQRSGLGLILMLSGALSSCLMVFNMLYYLGLVRGVVIAEAGWGRLYLAHILLTFAFSVFYLVLSFRKDGRLPVRGMRDLAIGLLFFITALAIVGSLLQHRLIWHWLCFLPGLCLVLYGFQVFRGRALWRSSEP